MINRSNPSARSSGVYDNWFTWLTTRPIFPLLFTIFPILSLYAQNIVFIPLTDVSRPLGIAIAALVMLGLLLWVIVRDWTKAGLIASLMMGMFFSYGHFENLVKGPGFFGKMYNILPILKWGWIGLILLLVYLLLRVRLPRQTVVFLNLCGLGLILQPGLTMITTFIAINPDTVARNEAFLSDIRGDVLYGNASGYEPSKELPDIYFLVLDGYERPDKLKEYYQLDVSPFIQSLNDRGFYIANQARSNYLSTTYSLNTNLNMVYFHTFPASLQKVAHYNLQTNFASDFLKSNGYQVIVFDSGTGDTNNQVYDVFISPEPEQNPDSSIRPFETLLLQTTMLIMLFPDEANDATPAGLRDQIATELDLRRSRIDSAFDHLADYAGDDQPQFLFAHIYSPHIPFLYSEGGKPLEHASIDTINWFEPAPEDYIQQYRYQVEALNQRIINVVDQIVTSSTRPVIILIQADHGDDHYLNWEKIDKQGVDLRSSILYAVYYTDGDYADFYPTISSVNTFRNVFNHWFGTSYPLLEDQVWFHKHSVQTRPNTQPVFFDACELLGVCIPEME